MVETSRNPAVARRRRILYGAAAIVLIAAVAFAVFPLIKPQKRAKATNPAVRPLIVARIKLRPVGSGRQSGLAEILRRRDSQSLRVMAVALRPNKEDEAYQLVLAGGADEQLLGTEVVGRQRIFVGETKVTAGDLQRHRRIELRRVTRGPGAKATLVLRGRLPR
jgi:hypothetical protein